MSYCYSTAEQISVNIIKCCCYSTIQQPQNLTPRIVKSLGKLQPRWHPASGNIIKCCCYSTIQQPGNMTPRIVIFLGKLQPRWHPASANMFLLCYNATTWERDTPNCKVSGYITTPMTPPVPSNIKECCCYSTVQQPESVPPRIVKSLGKLHPGSHPRTQQYYRMLLLQYNSTTWERPTPNCKISG